jgi:hypothetical protein
VPFGYRYVTMVKRDKEQLIRKLLKEGSDWDHIRIAAHCSPNTIQKVKEKSKQVRSRKIKSSRAEALRMYDKGYSSLDVAIKLDISFQEAENYKIDYWKHRDMDEFEQIYRAKKDSLPLILSNLRELQTRNISLDRLSQVIHLVSIMPQLNSDYQRLSNEESMRIINNDKLNYGIFKMRYILKKLSFINWTLNISELKRLIT